jgi:hypothetical protein
MKKCLFSVVILIIASNSFAQGLDYFVVFCGKEQSLESKAGHAFIAIGKGSPFTCNADGTDTEVWGLYANEDTKNCKPSSKMAGKSFFVGPVPGCLFSDIRTSFSNLYVIRCGYADYLKAQMVIAEWKNKKYELTKQDCLSFVIAIANVFKNRITIPERSGFLNFPNKYILELKKRNTK